MPTYEQIPIRLQLSLVSAPPVPLVDTNTGLSPKFWRAQDIAVQLAIFDADQESVDLTNVGGLQLLIFESPTSLAPLVSQTLGNSDLIPTVSWSAWIAGTNQQATFDLTSAETDLNLAGADQRPYWLVIRAVTFTGSVLNYGAGYVTVFNPGPQLPIPMPGVVSSHTQTNTSGNSTVTPTSLIHKEILTINGSARTSIIIVTTSGLTAGCEVVLRFNFASPLVAGIVLEVRDSAADGNLLTTITTDGYQPNACFRCEFNGSVLLPLFLTYPASPSS